MRITSMAKGELPGDVVDNLIVSGCYGAMSEGMCFGHIRQKKIHAATLSKAIEKAERSGESELSIREIADRKKQEHKI